MCTVKHILCTIYKDTNDMAAMPLVTRTRVCMKSLQMLAVLQTFYSQHISSLTALVGSMLAVALQLAGAGSNPASDESFPIFALLIPRDSQP